MEADELITKLNNIISDVGISIKFSDQAGRSLDPLRNIIREAINGSDVSSGEPTPLEEQNSKNIEEQSQNSKEMVNSLTAINETMEDVPDLILELEESINENSQKTNAQIQRIAETLGDIVLSMASASFDATKQKLEWLQDLEKAGIRLAGGFDRSFTQLANDAKMSHDVFVQMLVANSKQVAKMNALGSDIMATMMESSGNLVGKFGLTADEASKIMLHYMDTIGSVNTAEQLRSRNITTEVEALGKQMKSLSLATGKSVEALIQEQEQRRKNLLMEKIARDPTMNALLTTGLNAGISEDVMLAAITGRPNEASSQMNITAGGRALNRTLQQIALGIRSGSVSANDITPMLASLQKDSRIVGDVQAIENMSYGKAGALNDTALGNNLFSLSQFMRASLNPNSAQAGNGSAEENAMNSMANFQANLDKIKNSHLDKMAFSLDNTTGILDLFAGGLETAHDLVKDMNGKLYMVLAGLGSVSIESAIQMWTTNKLLDKFATPFVENLWKGVKDWRNLFTVQTGQKIIETLKTSIHTFGSTLANIATSIANSTLLMQLGIIGVALALGRYKDKIVEDWIGWSAKEDPWKYGITTTFITTVAGAAIGAAVASWFGAPLIGAAIGGVLGAGYGIVTAWNKTHEDDSEDVGYPAQNNTYNTSNTTQVKTYQENNQKNSQEISKTLKNIDENTRPIKEQTETEKRRYENEKLGVQSILYTAHSY